MLEVPFLTLLSFELTFSAEFAADDSGGVDKFKTLTSCKDNESVLSDVSLRTIESAPSTLTFTLVAVVVDDEDENEDEEVS